MVEWWDLHGPPAYISLAAQLGWKPTGKVKSAGRTPPTSTERVRAVDDLDGFMAAFMGAGGAMQ